MSTPRCTIYACLLALFAIAEVFAHTNHGIASPRPVHAKISGTKIAIARAEPLKKEMLSDTSFKAMADRDSGAKFALPANRIWRPGVKRLGNIFPEDKSRSAEEKEPA